ncbi:MAG: DUF427 domain-containing protein [Bacteroidales bacterium]
MKALWNDKIIAESQDTKVVEGNHYFPPESVKMEYLKKNDEITTSPWKGDAHFFDLEIDGQIIASAAWYYPEPKQEVSQIKNHIAFWKGVEVKS